MTHSRVLTIREAAAYLSLSESWMEKQRLLGSGPRFVKLGVRRVGYTQEALDEWVDARLARSTSDQTIAS